MGRAPSNQNEREKRAAERRAKMTGNQAQSFQEAEDWDLEFWQKQTPQARLSALVAIHRDVAAIQKAKKSAE